MDLDSRPQDLAMEVEYRLGEPGAFAQTLAGYRAEGYRVAILTPLATLESGTRIKFLAILERV